MEATVTSTVPWVTALYTNLVLHFTTSSINHIKSSNYFNANMYSTPTKKLESNDDLHVFVHLRRAQGECVFSVGHFSWACIFSATEKSRYWATRSNYELLKTRWPFVGRKIVCYYYYYLRQSQFFNKTNRTQTNFMKFNNNRNFKQIFNINQPVD